MPRILASIFLVVSLAGTFFPLAAFAGTYRVMQKDTSYWAQVEYEGLVPCGKCLDVVEAQGGAIAGEPGKNIEYITKQQCNTESNLVGRQGGQLYLNCQICHFFIMLDDVLKFMLIKIIPPLAGLMLVVGGVMFYFAGARPEILARAKKLIVGVAIGLFLIYGAYMIVGLFLKVLGAANVNPVKNIFQHGVFTIDCPVKIPQP